jgi:phosphatidate cytidylyltransferase
MLKTRVITGAVLAALLLLGLFLLPPLGAELAFGAVFTLGAWEWAAFGALHRPVDRSIYALCIALLLALCWRYCAERAHLLLLLRVACAWWVAALLWLSLAPLREHPAGSEGASAGGESPASGSRDHWLALACGIPVLVPAFLALARLQVSNQGFARGPLIVLWLVTMVCAADIGAYFAGRRFGRHRLAPRISPGKTWEGAAGGLAAVTLVACAGGLYFALPLPGTLAFGFGISVYSIIGDLTESMFKRAAGLKDSGALLPGHGGLLDRLDSVTAAAPLYALGLISMRAVG